MIRVFVLIVLVLGVDSKALSGCRLSIHDDFTNTHPLILKPSSADFVMPTKNGIELSHNESVRLECPGRSNSLKIRPSVQAVTAYCLGGTDFSVQGQNVPFGELGCLDYPYHTARYTGSNCSGSHAEIEVGFEVTEGFARVYMTCFDEVTKTSLYSWHVMPSTMDQQQQKVPRPNGFTEGKFYTDLNKHPSVLYTRKTERTTFGKLLASQQLANQYISSNNDYFLSRGHLTAKADFLYGSQQRATFYYINVNPQWQVFNDGNWVKLEDAVRDLVVARNTDLVVITGVYGQAKLPNVRGEERDLFLYLDVEGNALPVPEIYWKIVYDPVGGKATAFVGHNNPYEKDVAERALCKNVCDSIDYVHWNPEDVDRGFSYCCDVQELRKVIGYIPDIDASDLFI